MTPSPSNPLTWVEVDTDALSHNIELLRRAANGAVGTGDEAAPRPVLCAMVKGNAYGHGLLVAARAFVAAGVDMLGVGDVGEAVALRQAGIDVPLMAVCHISPAQMDDAVACDLELTVYDSQTVIAASAAVHAAGRPDRPLRLHLKVETGTHRQGLKPDQIAELARLVLRTPGVWLAGASTHFADIEDTTDHRFAHVQLRRFAAAVADIRAEIAAAGSDPERLLAHASNTAALLLWPDVCGHLVRFGIGAYGLWPSKETRVSARQLGRAPVDLRPALTWKTRILHLKPVAAGQWVGYGRTWRTVRASRLAVLPIGYYDGYDRGLSNVGQVLVGGQRAPVVGRVAMNMVVIDVSDAAEVQVGDEVILLGSPSSVDDRESDRIRADEMAAWLGTIHYEVVTRINERIPRVAVWSRRAPS